MVIEVVVGVAAGFVATPMVLVVADRLRRSTATPAPVPPRLRVWIVAAVAVLAGVAVASRTSGWSAAEFGVFAVLAGVAVAVDLAELRIPDVVVYPLLAAGITVAVLGGPGAGTGRLWPAVAGGAAYGGWMLLAALVVPDGYGLGDVKLAAAIGVWLGGLSWLLVAGAALFGQLLIAASLLAVRHRSHRHRDVGGHAPLGPAMVAGAVLALLLVR